MVFVQSTLCFDELYFCGHALQPISWTFFSFWWMGYLNRKKVGVFFFGKLDFFFP
jgi:hypothetical protein